MDTMMNVLESHMDGEENEHWAIDWRGKCPPESVRKVTRDREFARQMNIEYDRSYDTMDIFNIVLTMHPKLKEYVEFNDSDDDWLFSVKPTNDEPLVNEEEWKYIGDEKAPTTPIPMPSVAVERVSTSNIYAVLSDGGLTDESSSKGSGSSTAIQPATKTIVPIAQNTAKGNAETLTNSLERNAETLTNSLEQSKTKGQEPSSSTPSKTKIMTIVEQPHVVNNAVKGNEIRPTDNKERSTNRPSETKGNTTNSPTSDNQVQLSTEPGAADSGLSGNVGVETKATNSPNASTKDSSKSDEKSVIPLSDERIYEIQNMTKEDMDDLDLREYFAWIEQSISRATALVDKNCTDSITSLQLRHNELEDELVQQNKSFSKEIKLAKRDIERIRAGLKADEKTIISHLNSTGNNQVAKITEAVKISEDTYAKLSRLNDFFEALHENAEKAKKTCDIIFKREYEAVCQDIRERANEQKNNFRKWLERRMDPQLSWDTDKKEINMLKEGATTMSEAVASTLESITKKEDKVNAFLTSLEEKDRQLDARLNALEEKTRNVDKQVQEVEDLKATLHQKIAEAEARQKGVTEHQRLNEEHERALYRVQGELHEIKLQAEDELEKLKSQQKDKTPLNAKVPSNIKTDRGGHRVQQTQRHHAHNSPHVNDEVSITSGFSNTSSRFTTTLRDTTPTNHQTSTTTRYLQGQDVYYIGNGTNEQAVILDVFQHTRNTRLYRYHVLLVHDNRTIKYCRPEDITTVPLKTSNLHDDNDSIISISSGEDSSDSRHRTATQGTWSKSSSTLLDNEYAHPITSKTKRINASHLLKYAKDWEYDINSSLDMKKFYTTLMVRLGEYNILLMPYESLRRNSPMTPITESNCLNYAAACKSMSTAIFLFFDTYKHQIFSKYTDPLHSFEAFRKETNGFGYLRHILEDIHPRLKPPTEDTPTTRPLFQTSSNIHTFISDYKDWLDDEKTKKRKYTDKEVISYILSQLDDRYAAPVQKLRSIVNDVYADSSNPSAFPRKWTVHNPSLSLAIESLVPKEERKVLDLTNPIGQINKIENNKMENYGSKHRTRTNKHYSNRRKKDQEWNGTFKWEYTPGTICPACGKDGHNIFKTGCPNLPVYHNCKAFHDKYTDKELQPVLQAFAEYEEEKGNKKRKKRKEFKSVVKKLDDDNLKATIRKTFVDSHVKEYPEDESCEEFLDITEDDNSTDSEE